MSELSVQDLDIRFQKQVANARKAIPRNPAYAVDVLTSIVARFPACLEARRALRLAQQKGMPVVRHGGFRSGWPVLRSRLALRFGGESLLKRDPGQALLKAEGLLRLNPTDPVAHDYLARAARASGLPETAVFAYQQLGQLEPENVAHAKKLIEVLIELQRFEEAARVGEAALQSDPRDEDLPALIRNASVRQSIEKGDWSGGEGGRAGSPDGESEPPA